MTRKLAKVMGNNRQSSPEGGRIKLSALMLARLAKATGTSPHLLREWAAVPSGSWAPGRAGSTLTAVI